MSLDWADRTEEDVKNWSAAVNPSVRDRRGIPLYQGECHKHLGHPVGKLIPRAPEWVPYMGEHIICWLGRSWGARNGLKLIGCTKSLRRWPSCYPPIKRLDWLKGHKSEFLTWGNILSVDLDTLGGPELVRNGSAALNPSVGDQIVGSRRLIIIIIIIIIIVLLLWMHSTVQVLYSLF